MNRIDEIIESARNKMDRLETLTRIYDYVKNQMNWDVMHIHEKDEEHEEPWFTPPEEHEYSYTSYKVYCDVLTAIEKLAEK